MKEKIKNAFEALGFELEELDDFGCKFEYEGSNYLWMYSDNDNDFLNISLPGVLDIENVDEMLFYKLMDHLNGTLKYVKVNMLHDSMWFFYERELMGDEDLERVIPRMVSHLYHAMDMLHKGFEKCSSDDRNNENDNSVFDVEDAEIISDDNGSTSSPTDN